MIRNSWRYRQPIQTKKSKKYKLFILILKKATHRILSQAFACVKQKHEGQQQAIQKIVRNHERNMGICKILAWEKIRFAVKSDRTEERLFKDALLLAKRIENFSLRKVFNKIQTYIYKTDAQLCRKMISSRNFVMNRLLQKIFLNQKRKAVFKIHLYIKNFKEKRLIKIIPIIYKTMMKRRKFQVWQMLMLIKKNSVSQKSLKVHELQTQIQDMKAQITNKNENIVKLNQEINELKQNVTGRMDSTSFMANFSNLKNYNNSILSKSRGRLNSSLQKGSNDGSLVRDDSLGSLLSGSLFSYRSRGKSQAKGDTQECNCGYNQKYQRYKNTNQTLKKQIQIIKTELQFTKDMNQHMQNEMKQFVGGDDENKRVEKLKGQLRESQKQRELLREKIFKYEKYANKLKAEFKIKVQDIYRRVRKNG